MSHIILEVRLKRKTEKALRVDVGGTAAWLPLSKLTPLSESESDEHGCSHHVDWKEWQNTDAEADALVGVPEWLAKAKGLI
jgi:hypothetical protein